MGSCDINYLKALTLQSSPKTIWHIIVERQTFEVQFCLGEGKAVMWRQQVASRYYRRSARSTALGAWCRSTGATPSVYWVVLGRPYVTRGLGVVDRTVGTCPITCSPRHLTSHLFHSYISTTHSLRLQARVISFLCDSRQRDSYWYL